MKKVFFRKMMAILVGVGLLAGCSWNASDAETNDDNTFGLFQVNGDYLTSYKTSDITLPEAKSDIGAVTTSNVKKANYLAEESTSTVDDILTNYSSLEGVSHCYVLNEETTEYEIVDYSTTVMSGNFKSVLDDNEFALNEGISAHFLYVDDDILDDCEQMNEDFIASGESTLAPFKNVYSYHEKVENNEKSFVLRTNSYKQISSDEAGGATCTFIQQNEILYSSNGLAQKFQSSLGISIADKNNTVEFGTNYSVDFTWNIKE